MSDALRRVRELCGALGAYAVNLDSLRADHPVNRVPQEGGGGDVPLWGGTVGADASKVNGSAFWFDDIEPIYGELDELIRFASPELCGRVLSDADIRALAPEIHRVRAAYERDKELIQARALVDDGDARERLKNIIERESYWALGDELRRTLDGSRHVLVAGSGPLPISALCIGVELGVRVTCVERNPECHTLGRQLIAMAGGEDRFESVNSDILEIKDFDPYDAIVGVVLLGVGTGGDQASAKSTIARHVIAHMPPGRRLVLRDPHGLGMLLYPSVDLGESRDVRITRHVPEVGPAHPYRSGLVVAERSSPGTDHAH